MQSLRKLLEKKYKVRVKEDDTRYNGQRVNGLAFCEVLEKIGVIRSLDKYDVGLVLEEYG